MAALVSEFEKQPSAEVRKYESEGKSRRHRQESVTVTHAALVTTVTGLSSLGQLQPGDKLWSGSPRSSKLLPDLYVATLRLPFGEEEPQTTPDHKEI